MAKMLCPQCLRPMTQRERDIFAPCFDCVAARLFAAGFRSSEAAAAAIGVDLDKTDRAEQVDAELARLWIANPEHEEYQP